MERIFLVAAGVSGFLAVGLGAFGAHGLEARLADAADGARRLQWWNTAAHYHLVHSVALGLAAWVAGRVPTTSAAVAGFGFLAGMLVFSGSLYVMTVTGIRGLGAVTPIGGTLLLVGWGALAWAARSLGP